MWDLDTILRQHNQDAVSWMMEGARVDEVQRPIPENWALTTLSNRLKVAPPFLSQLLEAFANVDTLERFLELIRTYLPESEHEILSEQGNGRVYRFCYYFNRKYFPLPPGAYEWGVDQFVRGLQVMLFGMSYSAYHELDFRPGYSLLLSLIVYPYAGDDRDEPGWRGEPETGDETLEEVFDGSRVPLFDLVQKIVGPDAVRMVPANGWTPDALHKMTDGTKYEGVGDFADWACQHTGCVVLDANYENCYYSEGDGEPTFKWSVYNVKRLSQDWPKVQKIRASIDHIVEWLEADKDVRYRELVEFLVAHPKVSTTEVVAYDPWDLHIDLEQVMENEDDDDDD